MYIAHYFTLVVGVEATASARSSHDICGKVFMFVCLSVPFIIAFELTGNGKSDLGI
jgi:hypothetical protein